MSPDAKPSGSGNEVPKGTQGTNALVLESRRDFVVSARRFSVGRNGDENVKPTPKRLLAPLAWERGA